MQLSRSIRQVFRPVYGEKCVVRPKHWWHPRERKAAMLAAKVADYHAEEFVAKVARGISYSVIHGTPRGPWTEEGVAAMYAGEPMPESERRDLARRIYSNPDRGGRL